MRKEYTKVKRIESSIIEIENVADVTYNAVVSVHALGMDFVGQVVKIDDDTISIEVFGNTQDFSLDDIVISFEEKPLAIPLNEKILGRTFDGLARPIDNGGEIYSEKTWEAFFTRVNRTMNLVQPLVFIFVALIIVLLYAAMLMPMYQNMEVNF